MNTTKHGCASRQAAWQPPFLAMLPTIERYLRVGFRDLNSQAREEACGEGLVHSMLSYVRLFEQGRAEIATPSSLARYATLHVRRGRLAGCRLNSNDVLSRYGQISNRIAARRLGHRDCVDRTWIADVVDTRQASPAEQVAFKVDFVDWLGSLRQRSRRIATDLIVGFTTREVSRKYGLSAGRISQMRRELMHSWRLFQGEPALDAAG
jgi:hypothetical protein